MSNKNKYSTSNNNSKNDIHVDKLLSGLHRIGDILPHCIEKLKKTTRRKVVNIH